jgi:hypothetical protein
VTRRPRRNGAGSQCVRQHAPRPLDLGNRPKPLEHRQRPLQLIRRQMDVPRGPEPRPVSAPVAGPSIDQIRRRVISDLVDLDLRQAPPRSASRRHRLLQTRHAAGVIRLYSSAAVE